MLQELKTIEGCTPFAVHIFYKYICCVLAYAWKPFTFIADTNLRQYSQLCSFTADKNYCSEVNHVTYCREKHPVVKLITQQ